MLTHQNEIATLVDMRYLRAAVAAALVISALILVGCQSPSPSTSSGSGCVLDPEPLEPLPTLVGDYRPSHAVRAQAYARIVDDCGHPGWAPIGGLAYVYINAISAEPAETGTVRGGNAGPWPYENIAARMGFQFPIFIPPGLHVSVTATFRSFLDEDEKLACWLVSPNGVEIPGTRDEDVQPERGLAEANCLANIVG